MAQKLDPDVLRVELRYYIDNASNTEWEELYTFINSKAGYYGWWKDEKLVTELERRSADLKSGKDKGVSMEESRAHIKAMLKRGSN